MTVAQPSPNGPNRDALGRFAEGNPGGPGNPLAKRVADVKRAFLEAVTVEDIAAIARRLVQDARAGDNVAAKIILERTLGKDANPIEVAALANEQQFHVYLADGKCDSVNSLTELVESIHAADPDLAELVKRARAREAEQYE